MSTLPGLGGLSAFAGTPKRDYFKELGVRTLINADEKGLIKREQ